MSDLQLGLLIIGVLVVAGVIVYNKLQELRLRRRSQAESSAPRDVPGARAFGGFRAAASSG